MKKLIGQRIYRLENGQPIKYPLWIEDIDADHYLAVGYRYPDGILIPRTSPDWEVHVLIIRNDRVSFVPLQIARNLFDW